MKRVAILVILFVWMSVPAFAQSGKLFSADSELSNSLIYDMHQDRNGIIWIATEDGLNRYDGSKFTIYKHDKDDSLSILNNFAKVLFEDSKGNLFVGLFHGLQLYDYATDSFREIPMRSDNGEVTRPHITSIVERKNGDILIGTSGQGCYLIAAADHLSEAHKINWLVPSNHITTLFEDEALNIWVSTEDKGLYRHSHDNQLKFFFRRNGVVLNNISSICEDRERNILAGSLDQGLFMLDKRTDSFVPVPYLENPNLPIKTLYMDNPDEIYLGTDGAGIHIYNVGRQTIERKSFDVSVFELDNSKVHAILKDNAGNFWIGIYQKGVILIPAQTYRFNYIGYKSVKNNIVGYSCITAICEDRNGVLWIGTDNDGIYSVSTDGRQYAHFAPSDQPHSVPATTMFLLEDSRSDIWIGSYMSGVGKLDKATGECRYISGLLDENGVPVQKIYCLGEDNRKNLWIGTIGSGLFKMNLETNEITCCNKLKATDYDGDDNQLPNNWVSSLLFASDNKLYIGTFDGLGCLDLSTGNYLSAFGTSIELYGYVVHTLHEDREGTIWIGTSDGLFYLDRATRRFHSYTTDDGLPSNSICAIGEDEGGNLWISTYYGISQFNRDEQTFINYYANNGLQGNEFSKRAVTVDKAGNIFFGGINGITWFDPREIRPYEKKLDMRITDFYINDQRVKKGTRSGSHTVIDTSVKDAGRFRLSYRDNSFSIEFSAMEFGNPEQVTYMYALDDMNWITLLPGINRVSFSNLAPGKYRFRVKARDYNSHSDVKEIAVVIYPPWYLTAWAKVVYALILAAVLYLLVMYVRQRYRTRQRLLEHRHAEEINEAKLQFFMNIAHEIRTPMSLVISPLKKLISQDADTGRRQSYGTILRNAERILSLINQLMDIRKIDKGIMALKFQEVEIVAFIRDLYSYFEYQAKAKDITFLFHTSLERLPVWVDPKNFDKIILNVLSNAFKYTPENGKIEISLDTPSAHSFEVIVSDSGVGIREEERERIFERFYQIRNSLNNTNVSTGIGLHLTRSLVELHHGTIRVEPNEGGGSRFIIRIPLGKAHLKPEEMEDNPELILSPRPPADAEQVSQEPAGEELPRRRPKAGKRIYVVEDDEEIRQYICRELEADYHIAGYVNGKEAFADILKKAPDLVVSDVMMPGMDGITLCRKIKQNINTNHIPVVLVTAKAKEEDNLEGLSTGADAYIVKPFNMELLKKTVGNIIHTREMLRNTYKGNQQQEDKVSKIELRSADEKLMEKVMKVINGNLSNPELSVEMIADLVGISRVHLHRKLKELTNQTTRDFIRNVRLRQAAGLLAGKNLTISEVADATGFSSLGYFSNAFKELYGVSPSAYMDEHLKKETPSAGASGQ